MDGGIAVFLPLVLIFVAMYFLIIRPQNKKAKVHREMLSKLEKGNRVLTNGGLIGTIVSTSDQEMVLEIAKGVEVSVSRGMMAARLDAPAKIAAVADRKPKAVTSLKKK